jgi:3-methyladenine DNA glycosylase AlkD
MTQDVLKEIKLHRDPLRAKLLSKYFKTGKGQYAEGDIFWGLTVPMSRQIARKYKDLPLKQIQVLLKNKVHEYRLIALLILIDKYKAGQQDEKEKIVKFYLKNTKYINNWDLVDLPCCHILGEYLWKTKKTKILIKLANSKNLWEQRIAMVSTLVFVKNGDMRWTLKLAKKFLTHKHDLMHKATGWALREVGKRDPSALHKFLQENASKMPRIMLRYAIEKFPQNVRLEYLKK